MEEKKRSRGQLLAVGAICAVCLLLIVIVSNIETLSTWFRAALLLLRPILIGLALAYLCNPIFRFFEQKVLFRLRPPAFRRTLALTLTYIAILLLISAILLLIVPQLIESILRFASNYSQNLSAAIAQINRLIDLVNAPIERLSGNPSFFEYLPEDAIQKLFADIFTTERFTNLLKLTQPISILTGFASIVTDVVFAFFISLYLLISKEKRYAQIMKLRRALFSDTINDVITRLCTVADKTFGSFLEGKMLDCLIIGVLAWISFAIFKVPYALLLAALIAVFNLIPMIGPLIGAVPSVIILLLSDPEKVIPFLIIVILLQQLDNNVISPKILGDNTGVSSLCVLIAIITMGAVWGVVGLFLGVPLFASILVLIDELTVSRLQKKGLPSGLENYYASDITIDPVKRTHPNANRLMQRLERSAIRLRTKEESGEHLSGKDKLIRSTYLLLRKHRILGELTEEDQARLSAEQTAKTAMREATALYTRIEENSFIEDEVNASAEQASHSDDSVDESDEG